MKYFLNLNQFKQHIYDNAKDNDIDIGDMSKLYTFNTVLRHVINVMNKLENPIWEFEISPGTNYNMNVSRIYLLDYYKSLYSK